MTIHHSASSGYKVAADVYVTGRPDYPPEVVEWLRETLGLSPGKFALDVGSGTGKFLPCLQACGARIFALEPVAEMRARLEASYPDIEVLPGSAESIPLPSECIDAVVCAQSFHWFATAEALNEMRRVLRPGGVLGLIWNQRDERVSWVAELATIVDRWEADAPRFKTGQWQQAFPADGFELIAENVARNAHTASADQVIVGRVLSTSFIAALPPADRAEVEREVRAMVDRTPELAGRTEVSMPYETRMFAYRKVG